MTVRCFANSPASASTGSRPLETLRAVFAWCASSALRSAGREQPGQMGDQPLRLRKMRKRVVDHDAVKRGREVRLRRVTAEHSYVLLREFFARDARHFRCNVKGRICAAPRSR